MNSTLWPTYKELPLCVDAYGHQFHLDPGSDKSVCRRCGLVGERRYDWEPLSLDTAPIAPGHHIEKE